MDDNYYFRVISLGDDCVVAGSLRRFGYKECSYCFDWNITTLNFIIDCFNTKFSIFENLFENCKVSGNSRLKYNDSIYFYHEAKVVSNELKEKYKKRSKRLHSFLNETKEKILFIRKAKDDTIKDVQKLKNAIIHNYPNLKFKILLLNNIKQDNESDNLIIHKFCHKKNFIHYDKCKDICIHSNHKKSFDCVCDELKKINSEKFEQPKNREA